MVASRPTAIDLFAGAGLFSLAFKQVGFQLVKAIERDKSAAATYAANLGNHVVIADVQATEPSGRCNVLLAGPPCQGFSTLGARRVDDSRNLLSLDVVRWAAVLRPEIVVIENVEAFLHAPVWRRLVARLKRLRYYVNSFVLDSADFGVPQLRRRSFTIASRVGIVVQPTPRCRRPKTVRDAWEDLPEYPDGRNQHIAPKPSQIALARMKVIPQGGDKRDVMRAAPGLAPQSWWNVASQVTDAWGRMEWDAPCNTLRTAIQNASKGRYIHPEQNRVISLREAARLHSIHDGWRFEGVPTQIARQIGNSVPPKLGRAIARAILNHL